MKNIFFLSSITLVITFITLPAFEIIQNNAFLPFWYPYYGSHFILSVVIYFLLPLLVLNLIQIKFKGPLFNKIILGLFSLIGYSLLYSTFLFNRSLLLNFFVFVIIFGISFLTIRGWHKEIFWVLKILTPLTIILLIYSGWIIYSNLIGRDNIGINITKTVQKNDIYIFLLDGTNLTSDYLNEEKYPDPKFFPNLFSAIKNDFQWFYNARSNGPQSHLSVPTMFTGQLKNSKANSFLKNGADIFSILKNNFDITGIFRGGHNYFCRNFPDSCLGLNKDFLNNNFNSLDIINNILFENLTFRRSAIQFNPEILFTIEKEGDLLVAFFEKIKKSKEGGNLFFLHTFRRNLQDLKNFDNNFGIFTRYLKESGRYENSIILIISDHGLDISQKFTYGTKAVQNEKIFKVPFALKLPGINNGKSYSYLAQGTDIAPTILSLVLSPKDCQKLHFDGSNLLKQRPSRAFYFNMEAKAGLNKFGDNPGELIPVNPPWFKSLLGKISF